MKTPLFFFRKALLGGALLASALSASAQLATWIGPASGGDWATDANWSLALTPGVGTNVIVGPSTNVSYTLPMTSGSIASLTNRGTVNINTNGFIISGTSASALFEYTTARLFINSGGAVGVTNGGAILTTNSALTVAAGGALAVKNTLVVGQFGNSSSGGGAGFFTNNGGVVTLGGLTVNNSGNNQTCLAVINGGANDLGAVTVQRSAASSAPALGTEGLIINSGVVRTTSIDVGGGSGNSWLTMYFKDGVLTNAGNFTVRFGNTASRFARFIQASGILVSTNTSVHLRGQASANNGFVIYSVLGGTNMVGGFVLADAGDVHHSVFLTNSAKIYLGTGGISMGGGSLDATNVVLNSTGIFGALANWTNSVPMIIAGGTFNAADLDGNAHNITVSAPMRGAGSLTKTGNGTLTLTAPNIYAGNTTISSGTLALATDANLGTSGALASSFITVAAGATWDVSQVVGGYTLGSGKTVSGLGIVAGLIAGSGSHISPAGTSGQGTLNFTGGLSLSAANLDIELTDDLTGLTKTNDFVKVTGDLNLSGVTTISVTPIGSLAVGTYKLISYTGSLVGDASNFTCAAGTVVVNSGEIDLIVTTVRPAANLVWRGDGVANVWDSGTTSDWLNGVSFDRFYTGDTNTFDDSATNFVVNLVGTLTPASSSSVLINATNDYVIADGGSGVIHGATGLIKTNSGTLTITATANDYTGVTAINGGILAVSTLANANAASPIGAAGAASANLVINGGTLEYRGNTLTVDRGATLGANGGMINVTNATKTLAISGVVTGAGGLTKIGAGQLTLSAANNYAGNTVISNGVLALGSDAANNSGASSGFGSTNAQVVFAGGTLQLFGYNGSTSPNYNTCYNPLVVPAGQTGTLQMFSRGPSSGPSGLVSSLTGSGTLNLVVNYVRDNLDGDWSAFIGTINVTPKPSGGGDEFRINNKFGYANAAIFLNDGVVMDRASGANPTNDIGELGSSAGALVKAGNSSSGSPTWRVGWKNTTATFAGSIQNDGVTSIIKVGTGKWILTGGNTYSGSTTVLNGTLALGDGVTDGSINSTTNLNIAASAFVDVSGRSDATLHLGGSQILTGNGTVNGNLDGGGTISPGTGIGKLTITNVATLSGTLFVELNRTNAVLTNDVLVASSIVLGGTLTVTNLGPTLVAGDRFVLFSGPITGTFGTVNLPGNLGSVTYTWTDNTAVDGSIQVATVTTVNQTPTNLVTSISGNTLTLSWPTDHIGWRLQSQTSDLSTGLGSVWVDVAGTASTNSVDITLDPANGAVFYRMVYP
jgi:autotransporter-associated beta strand protein